MRCERSRELRCVRGVRERARRRREPASFVAFIIAHALTARASCPRRVRRMRAVGPARRRRPRDDAAARRRRNNRADADVRADRPRRRRRRRRRRRGAATMTATTTARCTIDARCVRKRRAIDRACDSIDTDRSIDRSRGGLDASRPFVNGRCVPRGGESPFRCGRSRCARQGSKPRARVGADAGSCDDDACAS